MIFLLNTLALAKQRRWNIDGRGSVRNLMSVCVIDLYDLFLIRYVKLLYNKKFNKACNVFTS